MWESECFCGYILHWVQLNYGLLVHISSSATTRGRFSNLMQILGRDLLVGSKSAQRPWNYKHHSMMWLVRKYCISFRCSWFVEYSTIIGSTTISDVSQVFQGGGSATYVYVYDTQCMRYPTHLQVPLLLILFWFLCFDAQETPRKTLGNFTSSQLFMTYPLVGLELHLHYWSSAAFLFFLLVILCN